MPKRNRPPDNQASRKYHDRVARRYDSMYEDDYWEFHDRLTWLAIRPHLPRDLKLRCCDLGCGTGKWGAKLLKSGFAVTFVDHSAAMIERTRQNIAAGKSQRATLIVADIIDMAVIESSQFALTLAMGDPLSICSDPFRAATEMFRLAQPGGVVIATADNKLAATDHYLSRRDIAGLEKLCRDGKTRWLTDDASEQFELTTFTPTGLRRCFTAAGFEVLEVTGKTILPIREHRELLAGRPETFDTLLKLERGLASDPSTAARAAHLQIVARRPAALEVATLSQ